MMLQSKYCKAPFQGSEVFCNALAGYSIPRPSRIYVISEIDKIQSSYKQIRGRSLILHTFSEVDMKDSPKWRSIFVFPVDLS